MPVAGKRPRCRTHHQVDASIQSYPRYQVIGNKKPTLISILTELESKLTSGGSSDTAINFLDSLRASIDSEQIRHDQLYTDQRNQCQTELELRTKDVKDAE